MIKSTDDLKKHVSVSKSLVFSEFELYVPKAIRSHIYNYCGGLYKELEAIEPNDPFLEIKEEAQELLDAAVANFGYFLFTPFNSVSMDASGMYTSESATRKGISMFQLNDIRRELLRSGHEAMDILLELLELNADVFPEWHNDYSTIYRDSLVYSTKIFNTYYNIFNSRQTFLALKSSIQQVEDRLLRNTFCNELLDSLKGKPVGKKEELLTLLQKTIVSATIVKVYSEGIFEITPSGVKLKFDTLPYETIKIVELTQQMRNTIESLTNDSNMYLKQAIELVKNNPTDFDYCDNGGLIESKNVGYTAIITRAIIGI